MGKQEGSLVLIGGGEDTRDDKVILRWIVELTNARNIAVIPTASSYPQKRAKKYEHAFHALGVPNVYVVDIRSKEQANQLKYVDMVHVADVVFLTGGDQVKLVNILRKSPVLDEIWARYNAGATIAGTSAGAAAAGNPMIFGGDRNPFRKGRVQSKPGFGFVQSVIIDTHFLSRGRISRLAQFLASNEYTRGIGLAEDTAIVIFHNNMCKVLGTSMITTLDASCLCYTDFDEIKQSNLISIDGLKVGFLSPGTFFDLKTFQVYKNMQDKQERLPKNKQGELL